MFIGLWLKGGKLRLKADKMMISSSDDLIILKASSH